MRLPTTSDRGPGPRLFLGDAAGHPHDEGEAAERTGQAPGNARHAVLVVDDSEQDLILLRAAFETVGLDGGLRWAKDADQARAYFLGEPPFDDRAKDPIPSLVLLDIQLTTEDGFTVLGWLRSQNAEWRRVPVIMLTTTQQRSEISRAYDMGANSFLTKPTGFEDLCKMVADLSSYWLKRNKRG